MKRRITIITEIIAPYRIPVFNELAKHPEIDLHVIFLSDTDATQRQWRVYKNEIRFPYQVLPFWRQRSGRHSLLLNWGAERALRRAAPDVIVCGGYNYPASWQSMLWARRNGVGFFLWAESTVRDIRGSHRLVESLKTNFLQRCNAFVVPGKSSADYLTSYGVPQEMIFTAPNAVDTAFFAQRAAAIRTDANRHRKDLGLPTRFFLFAGRLVKDKGVFDLLSAYAALTPGLRKEIGLVFVGDGNAKSALLQRAAAISPGAIHLAGFAQREQLATYYALAEVLAFPTHTDPWGLVVNEAMACGLPVIISTAAGCVDDLVENQWNGRVVSNRDVRQLASAMDELACNASLRSIMGQHSEERIRQYSPEAWAAGMAKAVLPDWRRAA